MKRYLLTSPHGATGSAEGGDLMDRSFAMLLKDLEKPAVVEMFERFSSNGKYLGTMGRFLDLLAPKTKAVRAFRAGVKARRKKRAAAKEQP